MTKTRSVETRTGRAIQDPVRLRDLASNWRSRRALLVVISGHRVGRMFPLEADSICIGRDKDCEVCLPHDGVSRRHARLDRDPGGDVTLVDLDSTNGTWVDGAPAKHHVLRDGEKIQIGPGVVLKFSYFDNMAEASQYALYERAIRDELTGVFNKMHFLARLRDEFAIAVREARCFSAVMMEPDNFPQIREFYGSEGLDGFLIRLAEIGSRKVREGDVFAHLGDARYAMLLRGQDVHAAHVSAERIRRSVADAVFSCADGGPAVTVSLGIAVWMPGRFEDARDMLAEADDHLYLAQRTGCDRTVSVVSAAS